MSDPALPKVGLGEEITQEQLQDEIDRLRVKNGDATCQDHKRATIVGLMVSKKLIRSISRLDEHLDRVDAKEGQEPNGIKTRWFQATGRWAMAPITIIVCVAILGWAWVETVKVIYIMPQTQPQTSVVTK